MQWPIIILVDNDSGADSLLNTIKDTTGTKPDRYAAYAQIDKNLYLVMTHRWRRKVVKDRGLL